MFTRTALRCATRTGCPSLASLPHSLHRYSSLPHHSISHSPSFLLSSASTRPLSHSAMSQLSIKPTSGETPAGEVFRPSSTMIVAAPIPKSQVVPGKANYKILLLKRGRKGTSANTHVFPGGNVDKSDHDPRWAQLLNYSPPEGSIATPLFNMICAIREAFEECGVLVSEPSIELSNDEIKVWRERVHNDGAEFYNLCTSHGVKPAIGRLCHFSSWITPPVEPKRFHTQFYLTVLPWSRESFSEHRIFADGKETVELDWMTPEEALDAYREGKRITTFLPPQFVTLSELLPIVRHEDLVAQFGQRKIVHIMPEFQVDSKDDRGIHLSGILPGDEEHSTHVVPGGRHRILITRGKNGMSIRKYVNGSVEVKARL